MSADPEQVAFKAEIVAIARDAADIASGLEQLRGRIATLASDCNQLFGGTQTFTDSRTAVAAGEVCAQIDTTVKALRQAIALARDAHGTM